MTIIKLLLTALIICITTYIIWYFLARWGGDDATVLPFSTWIKFYELAPEHWRVDYSGPSAFYHKTEYDNNQYFPMSTEKTAKVDISFLTAWQYIHWKHRHKAIESKKAQISVNSKLLGYIQEDIDEAKKKAEEDMQKSLKETRKYYKNLLKDFREAG